MTSFCLVFVLSAQATLAGSTQSTAGPRQQTLEQQATQSIRSGDFQHAAQLLREGMASEPTSVELWNLLGIAETELHHKGRAQEAFEHGLELAPRSVSLHENLGFLFYREEDFKNAQKYLERAVSLGSEKAGVRFSLAAAMLRNGRAAEALTLLKSLEPALSGTPDYWQERGRAELTANPAEAEASFARALALAPRNPVTLNDAASAAEKQGLDEKALAFVIRARQANPSDVPTLLHFAMICLRRDLGPDAVEALERARRLDPQNDSALYLLARAEIAVENWQQAYELFSNFIQRVPSFAPTYFALGWLDIKLNRVEDARSQLEHCLYLAPKLTDARYELAQLDLNDGQLDTAESLIQTVLQQNPHHAKANMAMGDLLMRRGNLEQAQKFLEAATHLDPQLASAHYKLSLVYSRRRQAVRAQQERELAAALTADSLRQSKNQLKLVLPESEIAH